MSLTTWRWSTAVLSAALIGLLLFCVLETTLLVVRDAVPRFMHHWGHRIAIASLLAVAVASVGAMLLIAGAKTGPAILRRTGTCFTASGIGVTAIGVMVVALPMRRTVNHGDAPAGDVAQAFFGMLTLAAGVSVLGIGVIVVLTGVIWSAIRRRTSGALPS